MIFIYSILMFTLLVVILAVVLMVSEKVLINYGECTIDINNGDKPLQVQGGQTLLSCLYSNEIFIPSACGGKGSCGFCKIVVTEGGGPLLPTETPYLSRKEIKSNVRLACQVKIRNDIFVRIPSDMLNVKMFNATVEYVKDLTYDIKEIRMNLDAGDEIIQRPGQYVQVQAPSDDGPAFRAYSISSPYYDKTSVELMVRLVPGGIASTYIHSLKAGDRVNFTGPYGEFYLNEEPDTEIVCVGGGVGMAPMKNIIYSIYEKWPDRICWLFFGCRTQKDMFYYQQYEEIAKKHPNFKLFYALSDVSPDDPSWDGETGFVHLSVDKHLQPGIKRQAFLCGPPPMIDAVTKILLSKGIPDEEIFFDDFSA